MDALLIVCGIALLLMGWCWLIVRARKLPISLLLVAILCPLATLFMRRRGYSIVARLLLLSGLLSMLGGAGWLYRDQPERFSLLISGAWLDGAFGRSSLDGELMGQPFAPERAVWRGSDLIFEEGPAERVRRALHIRFGSAQELLGAAVIERIPGDQGAWPELVLQWHTGALQAPGLKKITGHYSLNLSFVPEPDGRVLVRVHMHLPPAEGTRLTGEAWLERMPEWLVRVRDAERHAARVGTPAPAPVELPEPTLPATTPQWQPISLLALLDEPELFKGIPLRLTTWNGRVYEGQLKEVTEERRLVLAQPQGPNQVDFHFHPLDVDSIEGLYRR